MSNHDTAAIIEDGTNESLLAGGMTNSNSGLPQHVINELRRKAPQARQKKEKFDVGEFLRQIEQNAKIFSPTSSAESFEALKQEDRSNGNFGPRGIFSALVLNTFLDTVAHLRTAGEFNPQQFNRSKNQAMDLLREIAASPEEFLDLARRHDLELTD